MSRVRWGVMGCAAFAQSCTIPALLECTEADLRGVASRDRARAEECRARFGLPTAWGSYEELLEDETIDAVYIPLPNGLHGDWTIRSLRAGKHVVCEKPFCASAIEAVAVASAARQSGKYVMEAFMWRFHPQHERALERIRDGEIGEVRLVRAAFSFTMGRSPNVRWQPDLAGGAVADVGCYTVGASRYYMQSEPTAAFARTTVDSEYGVDARMSGILEFGERRANVDCAFDLPFRCDIEIAGEKGIVRVPKAWLPDTRAAIEVNGVIEEFEPANQYVREFEHFSRCVADGTPPRFGIEDAVAQMRALDALTRSARTGRMEAV